MERRALTHQGQEWDCPSVRAGSRRTLATPCSRWSGQDAGVRRRPARRRRAGRRWKRKVSVTMRHEPPCAGVGTKPKGFVGFYDFGLARVVLGPLDILPMCGVSWNHRHHGTRGGTVYDTFRVEVRRCGPGSCEVTVAGELDVATAPELRAALHQAVGTHEHTSVCLSQLTFCDCAGLGALLSAARLAKAHGTQLRLREVPDCVARLLSINHTESVFTAPQHETSR
ncbi:STAS domain-containing protein [Streptomyces sp. IBSNAI002]|uniref:STAS domain-containing protein n=1 Tax=Streptomyces sp. IBSNAI002 TaxID=3457500 RepID=UPI003FD2EDF3